MPIVFINCSKSPHCDACWRSSEHVYATAAAWRPPSCFPIHRAKNGRQSITCLEGVPLWERRSASALGNWKESFATDSFATLLKKRRNHICGQIVNERHAKESIRQRWIDLRTSMGAEFSELPSYHGWLDRIFAGGQLRRICRSDCPLAARLLTSVATILRGIPWPVLSLADLATRLTGDSHALDRGMPLGRLCLSAIDSQCAVGDGKPSRRQLWEWAGVVIDELSAPSSY